MSTITGTAVTVVALLVVSFLIALVVAIPTVVVLPERLVGPFALLAGVGTGLVVAVLVSKGVG